MYLFGLVWFCIWSVIAGFSQNEHMLDWCRALQGLGPAAFLLSGISLMGVIYRPGPRKNLVLSVYGASAPLGLFFGVLIAGLSGSFLDFRYYFWIGATVVFSTIIATLLAIPRDRNVQRGFQMDWLGSGLLVPRLVLTVFALTDGSHAPNKWVTPYIPVTLAFGIGFLAAAWYVEGHIATNPLIPFELFRVNCVKPFFIGLFLSYGVLGVFLLYPVKYMDEIMGATAVQISAWFVPMCWSGVMLSVSGGFI